MPLDPDAALEGPTAAAARARALAELRTILGARLYGEAERLLGSGARVEVSVLRGGRVITGTVEDGAEDRECAAKHRVYIRSRSLGGRALDGECSCGWPSPCLHVAAAAMVAAGLDVEPSERREAIARPYPPPMAHGAALEQRLIYVLEARPDAQAARAAGTFRLSVWVVQTGDPGAHAALDARPFVLRTADGPAAYPRYVDVEDIEMLRLLKAEPAGAALDLCGAQGARVLRQAVATGRARWHSPRHEAALKPGAARAVDFQWQMAPNGDQRLDGAPSESLVLLVDLEPPAYVDTAAHECGSLEIACRLEVLRRYWHEPPVAAERVAAVNERIAAEAGGAFPALQPLEVQRLSRASVGARLRLSAAAEATLDLVYNGMAIDGGSLCNELVRHRRGVQLVEIERDHEAEADLRAYVAQALGDAPRGRDAWLEFLTSAVPALEARGIRIDIDPGFPYRIAPGAAWYANLDTRRRREWFDFELGVTVDGERVNLLPVLVSYLQAAERRDASAGTSGAHLFVPLADGRFVPVAQERIERIAHTLVDVLDRGQPEREGRDGQGDVGEGGGGEGRDGGQSLALPVSEAARVAALALEAGAAAPTLHSDDPALRVLIEELRQGAALRARSAPAHFPATLRPYQEEGLGWLQFLRRHRWGGILADDMGLGKTVQLLAHLATEKAAGRLGKPSLIVAPVSVLGNWQRELARWTPELKCVMWHGAKRRESLAGLAAADVVLTGYPQLQLDGEILLAREFCFAILDEAQMIKNPRAKVSQAARALRAEHRLCLTGTPMENHLGELWSLLDFAQPGLLGDERQFQRHFRTPIEKDGGHTGRARALRQRVAPFLLRRTKDAVAPELPAKIEIVESIVLDDRQRDFYDGIRLAMHRRVLETIERQGLARSRIFVLDALLKLRQACCDPRLVPLERPAAEVLPSAKLDWLSTALPEMIAEGRRILLFSQFTSMLRLIETLATALSIPYALLTGTTRHRNAAIERFQSGAVPLFLISLKAGGTGLNLTAADTIIHYDPWWNPAAEAQATDRAHRIGQDKSVFVYKLIAHGTVEEKIMQLQADKHALARELFADLPASPASLSVSDLDALFAP